jgi:hypothetical protein
VGGALAVTGGLYALKYQGKKTSIIAATVIHGLLVLFSLVGQVLPRSYLGKISPTFISRLIGAIARKSTLIGIYLAMLTLIIIFTVGVGINALHVFFRGSTLFLSSCVASHPTSLHRINYCKAELNKYKGIAVSLFIALCLLEICELFTLPS